MGLTDTPENPVSDQLQNSCCLLLHGLTPKSQIQANICTLDWQFPPQEDMEEDDDVESFTCSLLLSCKVD